MTIIFCLRRLLSFIGGFGLFQPAKQCSKWQLRLARVAHISAISSGKLQTHIFLQKKKKHRSQPASSDLHHAVTTRVSRWLAFKSCSRSRHTSSCLKINVGAGSAGYEVTFSSRGEFRNLQQNTNHTPGKLELYWPLQVQRGLLHSFWQTFQPMIDL